MKIHSLFINDVRGIRNNITLEPHGENMVIYGPNGTGKSAVVDAIDFLFTGDISRLAGRGTRGMSLKDHGKHIDAVIGDAFVKATIEIDGIDNLIPIERHMATPKQLIVPEGLGPALQETLQIAEKGQHVLSRGEILKYIAAEAGKRAEEIQALLNLDKIEDIRKAFVTIHREADKAVQTATSNLEKSKAGVNAVFALDEFSEDTILEKTNECRTILKGQPISSLKIGKLKSGIRPRTTDEKDRIYPDQLQNTLQATTKFLSEAGSRVFRNETALRATSKQLKDNEKLKRDLANKKLLDIGISLIDDSGSCPLCLTKWEPGKLEQFLKNRLARAEKAAEIEKKISNLSTLIDKDVTILKGYVETLRDSSKKLKFQEIEKDFTGWVTALLDWSEALRNATEDYPIDEPPKETTALLAVAKWGDHAEKLAEAAKSVGDLTPEQKAWDALTALEHTLKRYFADKKEWENSVHFSNIAKVLDETYTAAKDRILESLFKSVNEDFIEYYRYLHGEDEEEFQSELKPDGSKLDFRVDFYGRGKHHPRALHSEGHQDSMGLCLYLALNKKNSQGKVKLVILDDVVMSIDAGHRRNVCSLLQHYFSDTQFFITTHNRTWARQLKTDGGVKESNTREFKGWSVDTGPKYQDWIDVWAEIKEKLDNNDVAQAAHQLREHLEFYFENVCDAVGASVEYKSDLRYELGDYLPGARSAYKGLLRQAKNSARSWGNNNAVIKFGELETQMNETFLRTQMEQWGINVNVHYSKWADFDKNDFLPIVEAFQDLEGYFKCSKCGGLLKVSKRGFTRTDLRCPCGAVYWNLEQGSKGRSL